MKTMNYNGTSKIIMFLTMLHIARKPLFKVKAWRTRRTTN